MLLIMGVGWIVTLICVLFALTAGVIRYLWAYQRAWAPSLEMQWVVAIAYWGAVGMVCLVLPLAAMPPNIGVIFSGMLLALVIQGVALRRREFTRSLNDAVLIVCEHGGDLSEVLRAVAWGKPYTLAGRIRLFCLVLDRGMEPIEAARSLRLPLEIDTMLALRHRRDGGTPIRLETFDETDLELPRIDLWPAGSQLAYLVCLLMGGIVVATFLTTFILPTFREMFEEFGIETLGVSPVDGIGGSVLAYGLISVVLATLLAAGLLLLLWLTDYRWVARCVPFVGSLMQSRRRAHCLCGLARVIESGREVSLALLEASEVERRVGQRARLQKAAHLLDTGTAFAPALGRSGLIDRSSEPWLSAAATNDRLPVTLRAMAAAMMRRARIRFDTAMSVIFPLGVILMGMFVLWIAIWVFGSLVSLIYGLS